MQYKKNKPIEFDGKWNLLLSDVPDSDIEGDLNPQQVNFKKFKVFYFFYAVLRQSRDAYLNWK